MADPAADLAGALEALLRAGSLDGVRVEAVLKPRPADPPPPDPTDAAPSILFTVGPVRLKG